MIFSSHRKNNLIILFIALFCLYAQQAYTQSAVTIDGADPVSAGRHLQILEDPADSIRIEHLLAGNPNFVASTTEIPNLGVTASSFWLKLVVRNTTAEQKLLLQLEAPLLDYLEFYSPDAAGNYVVQRAGEMFPFDARNYHSQNYIFRLLIPQGSARTYYLKIKSSELIQVPVTIGTEKALLERNSLGDLLSGIYFGIVSIMLFYNLFIYLTVRDKSYLYYVLYITFVGLTQACLHGYTFRFLWPHSTWLAIHSIFFIPAVSGLAAIIFVNNFLQIKQFNQRFYTISIVLATIYLVGLIGGIFNVYSLSYRINDVDALLLSLYMVWVAVSLARMGHRPAKFFLLAWSFFLAAVTIFVMKGVGILPSNNFTNYVLEIGSGIEITLLSFALADRINILRREKEESQRRALETLRENERIVSQQNVILEQKVKERTTELEQSNRHLKEAQVQLVNAEKMASLGQLTAGIAHEINNPINFVISNINPLKRDINDILSVLSAYEGIKTPGEFETKGSEIMALKKKLDLEYSLVEIDMLLKGIEEGASRTAEIVKGLKTFSRHDEEGSKPANIHTGMDATLLLLNNVLHEQKISVVKSYGDLPEINCYPGKLNQVFMNLLSNAIQAFQPQQEKKAIHISTSLQNDTVRISIKDNGSGMDESVKRRVFEPFFTTKNVGEGSGLGLSIVYGIMEKHGGKISVETAPGAGAEFIVELPAH